MARDSFLKANQQFTEAVQQLGQSVLSYVPGFRDVFRIATEAEKVRGFGRALGLTEAQISEVMDAWRDHYQATPWPVPWDEVRFALERRVLGKQWRPADGGR